MGTTNTFGTLKVRTQSETSADLEPCDVLVFPDGSIVHEGANEAHIDFGTGAAWVEVAVSAYADMATAVSTIGATPATLVIDTAETISTALTIPATLFLRIAKGAKLTKSGSGAIDFDGMGLIDAQSQVPVFSGFAVGDITWTGTDYPKEVSLELWDTANTSLSDRLERAAAAFNNGSKSVKFIAYPRVITKSVEMFDRQSIHFTVGDYTSTHTGYPGTFPPFLLNDFCCMTADSGAILYESDSPTNAHMIAAKMMYVAGADGTVEGIQLHNLYIKGHASQTHNGASSTIILGNLRNGYVDRITLDGTHAYGVVIGGFSTAGNFAENVEVTNFKSINMGTQILAMINGKNVTFDGVKIDVRNHNATGSFACIDVEPNTTDNKCENITVQNVEIDARSTIPGYVINGVTMQAANAPTMINPVVRNVRVYGKDLSEDGSSAGVVTNGVSIVGGIGGVVEDIYIQSATQQAVYAQTCRNLKIKDIEIVQCNSVTGYAVELVACAESKITGLILEETYTPYTQVTGIKEYESEYGVTSSGSTITETNPGGNPRFYTHIVGLTVTLNNVDYEIDTVTPSTYSITTTSAVGTLAVKTFASATDVNTGTDVITIASHGHNTGSRVKYTQGTTPVGGLTTSTTYFVIASTSGTLKLATTLANALAGTAINLTSTGTGTQTLTPVLVTKFSSNTYWNNTPQDVTFEPTGTSAIRPLPEGEFPALTGDVTTEGLVATIPPRTVNYPKIVAGPLNTVLGHITATEYDPEVWTNRQNISVDGTGIQTKISGADNWGVAGAASVASFTADFELEFIASETTTNRHIGIATSDPGYNYPGMSHSWRLDSGGNAFTYEGGSGTFRNTYVASTTVFKLKRVGTVITASLGATDYTLSASSSGTVRVYTALFDTGATINPVTITDNSLGDVEAITASQARTMLAVPANIANGTAALGTSAIASGASASVVTVGATGVATTDVIDWGFNSDPTGVVGYQPSVNGMLTIIAYPTTNNVNFLVVNNTAASVTPGAITLNWRIRR